MNKVDRLTMLRNAGTGKNDYTVYRQMKPVRMSGPKKEPLSAIIHETIWLGLVLWGIVIILYVMI